MSQRRLFNKLLIRFFCLVLFPFLVLLLLLLRFSNQLQLKNDVAQNEIITVQTLNSIRQQTEFAENMCKTVVQNQNLVNFLDKQYETMPDFLYYRTTIRDFVCVTNGVSDITLRIYMENTTIPMGFGIFYPISFINPVPEFVSFYSSDEDDLWLKLPEGENLAQNHSPSQRDCYHYLHKIKIASRCIGVIEALVPQSIFDITSKESDVHIKPIELEKGYLYNYSNYDLSSAQIQSLAQDMHDKNLVASVHNSPSLPFSVMIVTERYHITGLGIALLLLLSALFFTMIVVFFAYNKRFIQDIHSCLDGMEIAIANNFKGSSSDQFLPIKELSQRNDEISALAQRVNYLLQAVKTLLSKEVEQQTAAKEAQLLALQHQINPHFLYNTMEIFSSRMELAGLYEESDAISAFCRMLRYNINTSDFMSTIGDEVQQIKYYLTIQKIRGIAFEVDFDIPENVAKEKIIRFVLVPFIENSFKYRGSAPLLKISLSAGITNNCIELLIQNNGDPLSEKETARLNKLFSNSVTTVKTNGHHIGLKNINSRLKLFYGEAHRIHVECDGVITSFRFLLPCASADPGAGHAH